MNLSEMNGLEIMQALTDGTIPHPSIADTMSLRQIEVGKGFTKFRARADKRHLNPVGVVHGGFFSTLLDSAMGNAIHTELEAGVTYSTVDLSVKMLGPIPVDQDIFAEAKVLKVSKRVGVAEGRIMNSEGKILAHGTTTCVIVRP